MLLEQIDEGLLLNIFKIGSPSHKEQKMADFIKNFLSINTIDFTTDSTGNIFNISFEDRPLLSAHMDTVQKEVDSYLAELCRIRTYPDGNRILKGLGIIGGDDKCGIYLILELLKIYKNFNFVFSVEEEVGGKGIQEFARGRDFSKIPYGIVLDRRYGTDIICEKNNYGSKEFEDALYEIGKKYKYTPSTGSFSDANTISNFISCANLSAGYHNPHSTHEYVDLYDLLNAGKFTEEIINTITKRYDAPKSKTTAFDYKSKYPLNSTGYTGRYYGSSSWEDSDYGEYWKDEYLRGTSRTPTENPITATIEKKKKERNIKKLDDGKASYLGSCEHCNRYTTIYRLKKFDLDVCGDCLTEAFNEIVEIDSIRDPLNSGERFGY